MSHVSQMLDLQQSDPREIGGYQVMGRLGAGGQGVVYLATTARGERVAIKQLLSGLENQQARRQFAKEVAAARLVAPFCTAQVVDAQLEGPTPYVVSEYIEGPSLQQQVRQAGPMTGARLHRMAIGTATALAAIHQAGVVHRDFKPANVMLSPDGPRVIDFGIARDLSTETTVTSRIFGTPAYMSPEQLRAEPVGPAADMFAWASVIGYAATGRAPFEAEHMMAVVYRITHGEPNLTGVPAALVNVLRYCLEKDPARRPTAQQALALLLGRPAPEFDVSDPTVMLAKAADLAQAVRIPSPAPIPAISQPVPPVPETDQPSLPTLPPFVTDSATASPIPPRRRTSRLTRAAIAVLIVATLAGALGLTAGGLFKNDKKEPAAASSSITDPVVATTPPAEPTATSTSKSDNGSSPGGLVIDPDGGTIPKAFAGTWTGSAMHVGKLLTYWTVELELQQGGTTGWLKFEQPGCSGTAKVDSVLGTAIRLTTTLEKDPDNRCRSTFGQLVLNSTEPGQLTFVLTNPNSSKSSTIANSLHRA